MTNYRNVIIHYEDGYLITSGLMTLIRNEVKVLVGQRSEAEYINLISYLIDYIIDFNPIIKHDQTIAYHSWALKFIQQEDAIYNIHEAGNTINDFIEGVNNALVVVDEQLQECKKRNCTARFPLFTQKVAVSEGVLSGLDVEGVRYESPEHMTGWYITTDIYDDNIDSLKVVNYYELAFTRRDLIRFMALPFGFRFNSGKNEIVWYDENVY